MIDLTKLPAHEARIADLEAENDRLRDVEEENAKLKKEVDSLRDELAAVNSDLAQWKNSLYGLVDFLGIDNRAMNLTYRRN